MMMMMLQRLKSWTDFGVTWRGKVNLLVISKMVHHTISTEVTSKQSLQWRCPWIYQSKAGPSIFFAWRITKLYIRIASLDQAYQKKYLQLESTMWLCTQIPKQFLHIFVHFQNCKVSCCITSLLYYLKLYLLAICLVLKWLNYSLNYSNSPTAKATPSLHQNRSWFHMFVYHNNTNHSWVKAIWRKRVCLLILII